MTAREFLEGARKLDILIRSTAETLEKIRPPRNPKMQIKGKCSARENSETDRQIQESELEQQLAEYMEQLFIYKEAIVRLTTKSNISQTSKVLIQQRYMLGKTWKEVAHFMDYDIDHVRKLLHEEMILETSQCVEYWSNIKT